MQYEPKPIDTSGIELPQEVLELLEQLAKNTHENWAKQRLADGWKLGPVRDDARKTHPCLIPYAELSETEKDYDRLTATEAIKAIIALGYVILKSEE